jgi:hypothetical protein
MAYFQTKNPDLGKFWRVLHWKVLEFRLFYGYLVYFMVIWYTHSMVILWLIGIFYCYLVFFPVWYVVCTKKNLATLGRWAGSKKFLQHFLVLELSRSKCRRQTWPNEPQVRAVSTDWGNFAICAQISAK